MKIGDYYTTDGTMFHVLGGYIAGMVAVFSEVCSVALLSIWILYQLADTGETMQRKAFDMVETGVGYGIGFVHGILCLFLWKGVLPFI